MKPGEEELETDLNDIQAKPAASLSAGRTESRAKPQFDFRAHIIKISKTDKKTGQVVVTDYVPPKWRVVGLRYDHPDATIDTDMVFHDPETGMAIFKARVMIPTGGYATGWGSETKTDFFDYIEKAETKAVGRALAALGYGTEGADDLDSDKTEADPRDYEVNKANTVEQKAASPRYHTQQSTAQTVREPQQPVMQSAQNAQSPVQTSTKPPTLDPPITGPQQGFLAKLLATDDAKAVMAEFLKREGTTQETLTKKQASLLIDELNKPPKPAQ